MTNPITQTNKQIMRIGVYGVAIADGKILLIEQNRGPYFGKLDFPGGGIEFGESPNQALLREFAEEVAMTFESSILLNNLTATVEVHRNGDKEPYTYYQIGMIYRVLGILPLSSKETGDLKHRWVDLDSLSEIQCAPLLWKFKMTHC
jgi:ADP-ribose pyrophosphatase YjhB (NUDIX family)